MEHYIAGQTAVEIAASLERAVQDGSIAAGAAVPPIRQLAATLRVSPVTVAAAYRQLQLRGWLVSGGRRGTRVRSHPPAAVDVLDAPTPAEGLVDLATGNPDPDLLPPLGSALRSISPTPQLYGGPPMRRDLASFAANEFATDNVPAEALTVAGGALDAIERLLRDHLRPGDAVAIEDPGAPALLDLVGASGFVVRPVALDDEGPVAEAAGRALRDGARALIVTPRAQNPTGAAVSAARAAALADLVRDRDDLLLIENDPAGPVSGQPYATSGAGTARRWAVVRSVSKFLGPDLRIALVAGDTRTIARLQGRQVLGARWVSHLLQQLTVALWSDPANGRRLARAADVYTQRRTALMEALAAHGVRTTARSGFNIWIPVRDETAAVQALAGRGWAVAPGERFRIRSAPAIRVTTSGLAVEAAERFAADCAAAVRPSAAPFA